MQLRIPAAMINYKIVSSWLKKESTVCQGQSRKPHLWEENRKTRTQAGALALLPNHLAHIHVFTVGIIMSNLIQSVSCEQKAASQEGCRSFHHIISHIHHQWSFAVTNSECVTVFFFLDLMQLALSRSLGYKPHKGTASSPSISPWIIHDLEAPGKSSQSISLKQTVKTGHKCLHELDRRWQRLHNSNNSNTHGCYTQQLTSVGFLGGEGLITLNEFLSQEKLGHSKRIHNIRCTSFMFASIHRTELCLGAQIWDSQCITSVKWKNNLT